MHLSSEIFGHPSPIWKLEAGGSHTRPHPPLLFLPCAGSPAWFVRHGADGPPLRTASKGYSPSSPPLWYMALSWAFCVFPPSACYPELRSWSLVLLGYRCLVPPRAHPAEIIGEPEMHEAWIQTLGKESKWDGKDGGGAVERWALINPGIKRSEDHQMLRVLGGPQSPGKMASLGVEIRGGFPGEATLEI